MWIYIPHFAYMSVCYDTMSKKLSLCILGRIKVASIYSLSYILWLFKKGNVLDSKEKCILTVIFSIFQGAELGSCLNWYVVCSWYIDIEYKSEHLWNVMIYDFIQFDIESWYQIDSRGPWNWHFEKNVFWLKIWFKWILILKNGNDCFMCSLI